MMMLRVGQRATPFEFVWYLATFSHCFGKSKKFFDVGIS